MPAGRGSSKSEDQQRSSDNLCCYCLETIETAREVNICGAAGSLTKPSCLSCQCSNNNHLEQYKSRERGRWLSVVVGELGSLRYTQKCSKLLIICNEFMSIITLFQFCHLGSFNSISTNNSYSFNFA